MSNSKKFKEALPTNCPPNEADELAPRIVIRLVRSNPAEPKDFLSGAAKGEKKPRGVCDCQWSSCSVFVHPMKPEKLADLLKFPKMRDITHQALVAVGPTAGRGKIGTTGHIDLWMYESFDPCKAVQSYGACS